MDVDDLVLELVGMYRRNYRRRRQMLGLRGVEVSSPAPTAEQIILRKIEQERRRLEALTNQLDLNMQSDIMTEFEESLKYTHIVTIPEQPPSTDSGSHSDSDSKGSGCG